MKLRVQRVAILVLTQVAIAALGACGQVPAERAASDKYRLVWNDDPSSTMTIIWDQLQGEQSHVLYGTEDFGRRYWKYPNTQAPARQLDDYYGMNTRYARLQNLEPDQTYFFVIQDSVGVSDRFYFRTAPNEPKAFTFVAGGDTKSVEPALAAGRASNRMVSKLRPLFVLFNGDFTTGNGTDPNNWHQWLMDWDSLATTSDGRRIPIVPVHGNHENGNRSILNKIFDAPFQYGDSTNLYYSLSFGGDLLHLIALDSEIEEGGMQREWLEADLESHRDYTFKMAGYHKPFRPHTRGKGDQDHQYEQWAGLFYEYGLDLSFDADSHMHKITFPLRPSTKEGSEQGFVRDDENGTLFLGEGAWGAVPRANDDDKSWTYESGSFNQLKWIHVKPENANDPASVEIFTVITGQYDEAGDQTFFVDGVENLEEEDVSKVPEGINLFQGNDSLPSVLYPFYLNGGSPDYLNEPREAFGARMEWWRDARFGMFIHWGPYAVPAGVYNGEPVRGIGEWIMNSAQIPIPEYETFAAEFNPVQFDADEWVRIAKDAGMKYIIITSKHHDGFGLWDSEVSDYDIMDASPFGRDILKELAEAAEREGLRLGFYHSIMDWHHPDAQGPHYPTYNTGEKSNSNFPRYVEDYLKPQVRELVRDYDPAVLWFDGEWVPEWTHQMGLDLYGFVRSMKPDILVNNRVDKGRQGMQGMTRTDQRYAGDFGTPEQEILEGASVLDWESCMTMNDTWGFKSTDDNWKSAEMLIHNLVDIAAKGGNYLLNVGPTEEGLIPSASVERLAEMGEWMEVNAEAIYGSRGWTHHDDGDQIRYTHSGEHVYAISLGWPGREITLHHVIPEAGSEIYLLGYEQPLDWSFDASGGDAAASLTITLPEALQEESERPCKYAYSFKIQGGPVEVF